VTIDIPSPYTLNPATGWASNNMPQQVQPEQLNPPQGMIPAVDYGVPSGNAGTVVQAQTSTSPNLYTVGHAIAAGWLPLQVQVVSYTPVGAAAISFANFPSATLSSLISSGLIPLTALLPQIAFASPNASYGGA
jgi:hypothetical protein